MRIAAALALLCLAVAAPVSSQESPDHSFDKFLFPPELVMHNQQKIGLRPDQRTAITEAIQQLQTKVIELQWKMQDEAQKLGETLAKTPISETETLAQVDRVLAIEREIKRAHIAMLVRIRNALTPEQHAMLRSLK